MTVSSYVPLLLRTVKTKGKLPYSLFTIVSTIPSDTLHCSRYFPDRFDEESFQ